MKKISALILSIVGLTIATSFAMYSPDAPATNGVNVSVDGKGMPTLMMSGEGEIKYMGGNNEMMRGMFEKNQSFEKKIESRLQDLAPAAIAGLVGVGIILTIMVLLGLAFWVWMLVHAIRHDIDYKPVWILVLFFLNIWGAIVYYFAIKRQEDCYCCDEEVFCGTCGEDCGCAEGTCKMKDMGKENDETKI